MTLPVTRDELIQTAIDVHGDCKSEGLPKDGTPYTAAELLAAATLAIPVRKVRNVVDTYMNCIVEVENFKDRNRS